MSMIIDQKEKESGEKLFEIVRHGEYKDNLEALNESVVSAYDASREFFDQEVGRVRVHIFYTREELDQFRGRKSPEWVVGFADEHENIGIFSPGVFDKVSSHPMSDFPYVLAHEVAHFFTNKIFKLKSPQWLREGLAGYVAKQYQIRSVTRDQLCSFDLMHTDWRNYHNYPQAYLFTRYLIDQFGKEKFIEFLSFLKEVNTPEELAVKFEEVVETPLADVEKSWITTLS